MTTVKHAIGELDVVELLEPVDRIELQGKWPAGTVGAVVSDHGDLKLVEIADHETGEMLDLISVPETRLRLLSKHSG
jgi:hypothetical protein